MTQRPQAASSSPGHSSMRPTLRRPLRRPRLRLRSVAATGPAQNTILLHDLRAFFASAILRALVGQDWRARARRAGASPQNRRGRGLLLGLLRRGLGLLLALRATPSRLRLRLCCGLGTLLALSGALGPLALLGGAPSRPPLLVPIAQQQQAVGVFALRFGLGGPPRGVQEVDRLLREEPNRR